MKSWELGEGIALPHFVCKQTNLFFFLYKQINREREKKGGSPLKHFERPGVEKDQSNDTRKSLTLNAYKIVFFRKKSTGMK